MVKLGVKTFQNCLDLSTLKIMSNIRKMFRTWHNNAFPKLVLSDITERALQVNQESRTKLKALSVMD